MPYPKVSSDLLEHTDNSDMHDFCVGALRGRYDGALVISQWLGTVTARDSRAF